MSPAVRDAATRRRDVLSTFVTDVDCWAASAGEEGPWLVPLSFGWDGEGFLLATSATSRFVRDVTARPRVRLAFGHPRDVVMVEGATSVRSWDDVPTALVDDFTARVGSDPRRWADVAVVVRPARIQAWRNEEEIEGRELMRDGRWLDAS